MITIVYLREAYNFTGNDTSGTYCMEAFSNGTCISSRTWVGKSAMDSAPVTRIAPYAMPYKIQTSHSLIADEWTGYVLNHTYT